MVIAIWVGRNWRTISITRTVFKGQYRSLAMGYVGFGRTQKEADNSLWFKLSTNVRAMRK